MNLGRGLVPACLAAAVAAGCGMGLYQTAKTLPPDCRSIPVKVEFESWISGAVVVSVS